jgi:hypothetical protein
VKKATLIKTGIIILISLIIKTKIISGSHLYSFNVMLSLSYKDSYKSILILTRTINLRFTLLILTGALMRLVGAIALSISKVE